MPSPSAIPDVILLRATRAEATGASLRVGGLPIVERALRQLERLPATRVVIASDGAIPLPSPLPANVEVRTVDAAGDGEGAAVALAALEAELRQPFVLGADVVRPRHDELEGGLRVVDEATRKAAEDAVFASFLRGDLGFIARHVNKRISFRITRDYLCRWPFTPNEVTLGAGVIGLLGCFLIATGSRTGIVLGFLLAQLQSILDGCDGELARIRFQQTAIGEWLDTIVDDALNLALVAAVGIGLSRSSGGGAGALWIALVACGMLLTYNVVAYRELVRQGEGGEVLKVRWWFAGGRTTKAMTGGARGPLSFVNIVAKRDFFVFAWMVLAIFDLLPIVLFYGFCIALGSFVMAAGQVVTAARRRPSV